LSFLKLLLKSNALLQKEREKENGRGSCPQMRVSEISEREGSPQRKG
jgi:hypothetical protein